jgi:hypothetical protein
MRKQRTNRHLVAYCENSEKKRQNFAGFPSNFRICWLFFWNFMAKIKKFKKKKKDVFFCFPLKARGDV